LLKEADIKDPLVCNVHEHYQGERF
jgi:hypothetical protein